MASSLWILSLTSYLMDPLGFTIIVILRLSIGSFQIYLCTIALCYLFLICIHKMLCPCVFNIYPPYIVNPITWYMKSGSQILTLYFWLLIMFSSFFYDSFLLHVWLFKYKFVKLSLLEYWGIYIGHDFILKKMRDCYRFTV